MNGWWIQELGLYGWVFIMGLLVITACGLSGSWLVVRGNAMIGDALSHAALPGIAIAYLISGSRSTVAMLLGALCAGLVCTASITWLQTRRSIKQDAAIGVSFSALFAFGVVLIALFANRIELDLHCVLYGEIGFVGFRDVMQLPGGFEAPVAVVRMAWVTVAAALFCVGGYRALLAGSFDDGLARTTGLGAKMATHGLMAILAVVVVAAFEAVGAILVVAMLVLPAASAMMLTKRMPWVLAIAPVFALISAAGGLQLGLWLNCSIAAAMVLAGAACFILAMAIGPRGLMMRRRNAG